MVGFLKSPTGRLGNVMIQYAFMRRIAEKANVDYFHGKLPYSEFFNNFNSRNAGLKLLFSKKKSYTLKTIEKKGIDAFLNEVSNCSYNVVLDPPVLGHLFDDIHDNPSKYFELNSAFCSDEYNNYIEAKKHLQKEKSEDEAEEGTKTVAIHYRGTDFTTWDAKALMEFEYYNNAIDYIENDYERGNIIYKLYTDDIDAQSYKSLTDYLGSSGRKYVNADPNRNIIMDLTDMSMCDAIISSPSTYAIIAGIIGKQNKTIIHNKRWTEYCASKGESFWIQILKGGTDYYIVEQLI